MPSPSTQLSLNTPGDHVVQHGVVLHEIGPSGRLISGSKSRVPKYFWSAKLKKSDEKGNAPQEKGLPVTAKFDIAAPNSTFLRSIVEACSATKKYTVFENEVIQTVAEHKWSSYVEKMFFFHLYLDIAMVFFLTNTTTFEKIKINLGDFWNVLDVLSPSFIFVAYASRIVLGIFSNLSTPEGVGVGGVSFHSSKLAMAFALPLSYLNTLFYMQGSKDSGELVRMIIGIIQGILVFLAILIVCMIGFAASFLVLFEGQSNSDGDSTHSGPPQTFLLSYTENAKAEFIFARANIIFEFEGTLTEKQKEKTDWFPTWLQVLVPTLNSDSIDSGDWVRRFRALKISFNKVSGKLDASEKARKEERRENEKKEKEREKRENEREEERKRGEEERKIEIDGLKKKLDGLEGMLSMLCANFTLEEKNERILNVESNRLLEEIGVSVEDLDPTPIDAKSKNEGLKVLKRELEEEEGKEEKVC
ncbi:hypothetical protein TL16_g11191 [Triparma laevis f. inornata]|uniref:Ion transport domain-containing protein n=1 Tax=Triparma laevis f. inornata TaxID=1714386 RepID=A0A9W7BDS2_9STRA|nr:hypothetical protein TL16_g11191 [Triparma laevis f. inornata]